MYIIFLVDECLKRLKTDREIITINFRWTKKGMEGNDEGEIKSGNDERDVVIFCIVHIIIIVAAFSFPGRNNEMGVSRGIYCTINNMPAVLSVILFH